MEKKNKILVIGHVSSGAPAMTAIAAQMATMKYKPDVIVLGEVPEPKPRELPVLNTVNRPPTEFLQKSNKPKHRNGKLFDVKKQRRKNKKARKQRKNSRK